MTYTHPKPLPLTVETSFFIKHEDAAVALPVASILRNIITLRAITVAGAPPAEERVGQNEPLRTGGGES